MLKLKARTNFKLIRLLVQSRAIAVVVLTCLALGAQKDRVLKLSHELRQTTVTPGRSLHRRRERRVLLNMHELLTKEVINFTHLLTAVLTLVHLLLSSQETAKAPCQAFGKADSDSVA